MSSQKKARGLPGMKEGPLVQMLNRQRVQQASANEAKKLVDTAAKSSVLSQLSGLENVVFNSRFCFCKNNKRTIIIMISSTMSSTQKTCQSLGGVGPVRGLRGGGRGGWCEEWVRSG